jgi:hypothetical protein
VRRILRTAVRFNWLDRDQLDLSIPRYNQQGRRVALDGAREALVLLKNEGNLLPLDKKRIKSIAVIGPLAYPAVPAGGGSARVEPFAAVSFLEGLSNYLGTATKVYYARGLPTLNEMAEATAFSTTESNGQSGLRAEYFTTRELQELQRSLAQSRTLISAGNFAHSRNKRFRPAGRVITFRNDQACMMSSPPQPAKTAALSPLHRRQTRPRQLEYFQNACQSCESSARTCGAQDRARTAHQQPVWKARDTYATGHRTA